MTHQILGVLRGILKLFAILITLLFLAGFGGQFLPAKQYPWVLEVWRYTRPVSTAIAHYVPTIYRGIDYSLILALVLLWGLLAVTNRWLQIAGGRLRGRRIQAKMTQARERVREERQAKERSSPAPRPSGYRPEALVVIDLVGSSVLGSQFGSTFLFQLKERLREQVLQVSSKHNLTFSKSTGDGFLLSFPSVSKAIGALRELYTGLPAINHGLPEGAEIAVRAAMNFGEVLLEPDGDRIGTVVHKAFRLEALHGPNLIEAEGGIRREEFPKRNYILLSEEAMSAMPEGQDAKCRLLGLCELKGFPGFHRVYSLQWES